MEKPATLPTNLVHYCDVANETELFNALRENTLDLVNFFVNACDDESWTDRHQAFAASAINLLTRRYFRQNMPEYLAVKVADAIKLHRSVLRDGIPTDIQIQYNDNTYSVNYLLVATESIYLRNLIATEGADKNIKKLKLRQPNFTEEFFRTFVTYVQEGIFPELWQMDEKELIKFMQMAIEINCKPFEEEAAKTCERYLHRVNVYHKIVEAYHQGWQDYLIICIQFANQLENGTQVYLEEGRLALELQNYLDDTLDIFKILSPLIYKLICKSTQAENPQFPNIVQECSEISALDVSQSDFATYIFKALQFKPTITALDISHCLWVTPENFAQLLKVCPQLSLLWLKGNSHLTYRFWGCLTQIKNLLGLDLSSCLQITDSDFKIIVETLLRVQKLSLAKCNKLTDFSFIQLGRRATHLQELNISYCLLSDAPLIEITSRCRQISKLNLQDCTNLTETGIIKAVNNLAGLQELDIRHCAVSKHIRQEIISLRPQIVLKYS